MQLDGPIVLCGRSDNDTLRGYNGRLTQLAIFDTALSPLQVFYMYKQVWEFVTLSMQPCMMIVRS